MPRFARRILRAFHDLTDPETEAGKRWDAIVGVLAILSVVSVATRTFEIPASAVRVLRTFEATLAVVFTAEAALRQLLRLPFFGIQPARGMVDGLSIVPWWVGGADTLGLRCLVALRLVRIAAVREALIDLAAAAHRIRGLLVSFALIEAVFLTVLSLAILDAERSAQPDRFANAFDGFWWAIVTVSTVGYGDAVPVTTAGRLLTLLALPVGIGLFVVPVTALAEAYAKIATDRADEPVARTFPANHQGTSSSSSPGT